MVSEDFSKESASSFLRQCLASNMDTNPLHHTQDVAYSIHFPPDSVPVHFTTIGEQICRPEDDGMVISSLISHEARKENPNVGVSFGNGNGLSLTLGSHLQTDFQDDRHAAAVNSNYSSNGNMNCEREISSRIFNASNPSTQSFNGMVSVLAALQSSPYMKPAQQLLDEVVCVSNAVESDVDKQARRPAKVATAERISCCTGESMDEHEENHCSSDEKHAVRIKIGKLVALLDQLESRHDQYFHQMDKVVSSFEAVAGARAAASYTALTIQAMSKHFSNLRDAIIAQINCSREFLSRDTPRSQGDSSGKSSRQKKETLQSLGMIQLRQAWRPLRGLPEESVVRLRSWLFEHFLHPYPTDNEKLMLASQTGLTRNQISNWFINARVRLWKPMIEEMYREEFADHDMQD